LATSPPKLTVPLAGLLDSEVAAGAPNPSRTPGWGESNHTLPYNNGGSLHVGPVCILGGSAEAEIETICVLCVGAIDSTAAGCCQIYAHSLVSVDRLPSRAGAGRSRRIGGTRAGSHWQTRHSS
jgi:hypothetical protein